MAILRRIAWAPICFFFGHNFVHESRPPLTGCVICVECGKRTTGEPTLRAKK